MSSNRHARVCAVAASERADRTRSRPGAVYVEYLALLSTVTLVAVAAIAALGVPLIRLYRYAQMVLSVPFP